MRRFLPLLIAGLASATAGCSSLVHRILNGPSDLDERRRAAEVREKEADAKNVLHWTDTPTDPAARYEAELLDKKK